MGGCGEEEAGSASSDERRGQVSVVFRHVEKTERVLRLPSVLLQEQILKTHQLP